MSEQKLFRTYVVPFVLFLALNLLLWCADASWAWDHPSVAWYRRAPEMWIYPLQVLEVLRHSKEPCIRERSS